MTPAESWTVVGVGVFGGAYAITGAFALSGRLVHYLHRVGWRGAAEAVVGGAYLAASAGLTVVLAPIAMLMSDKQAEAEDKLAEAVTKPKRDYDDQRGYAHVPGERILDLEPGVTTDEEFQQLLEAIKQEA